MEVELYYEPRQVCQDRHFFDEMEPEMTEFESAYLCGLIKEYKPQKIVEIGVAGGGTTTLILQALELLQLQDTCKVYSMDYSKQLYNDNTKLTGYLAEKAKTQLNGRINHTFMTGNVAPVFLNEIGDGIDFIVLDTVHSLPGEILDFLAIFPLLKKSAVCVLHDVVDAHTHASPNGQCTQTLLCSVVADKYDMKDNCRLAGVPNIGAFIVNEDTEKHIENVFSTLKLVWSYLPPQEELDIYARWYKKYYDEKLYRIFDDAVVLNSHTLMEIKSMKKRFLNIARIIYRGIPF